MKYKSLHVARHGGPEVLEVVEHELRPPAKGEVRIKVLAASVSRPDVTVRRGEALYSGTWLGQKLPFTPGYAVIGAVEAVGEAVRDVAVGARVGVLTVIGGYTEYLYWRADRLIPVPAALDPAEAVPLILNYIVAYQTIHRVAKVRAGETALIIGAKRRDRHGAAPAWPAGGAGAVRHRLAAQARHPDRVRRHAIDYRAQDFVAVIRQAEPGGLDVVLDGMMRLEAMRGALALLRRGGRLVSFGEPASRGELLRILGLALRTRLTPNGKSLSLYGTSTYFLFSQKPYLEDWATLFQLMVEGKLKPVIAARFSILAAAEANAMLERGDVIGNVVLVSSELLSSS
jgi:NADPH:quinone reductase-like Zn-dependent oxidoreductase